MHQPVRNPIVLQPPAAYLAQLYEKHNYVQNYFQKLVWRTSKGPILLFLTFFTMYDVL